MGLLADYLPALPGDPNQNSAARQGLLAFGAAMLGGRGNFGSIMGQGLAAGAGGYNNALQALQQKALADAQTKHYTLANDATEAENAQNSKIAAGLQQFNAQQPSDAASLVTGQPAQPAPLSSTPQASLAPDAGLPRSMFPQSTAAPAQPVAPVSALPQVGGSPAAADPLAGYKRAVAQLEYLNTNFPGSKQAAAAQKTVETLTPKIKETKVVTIPGTQTRVLANFFDNPAIPPQILRDVSPDMEKLAFHDAGGTIEGLDAYTGASKSSTKKTVSESDKYSRETQIKVQKMIDARQAAADAGEPEAKLQGDELRMMGEQYLAGDKSVLQNLGRGKQGAENIVALRREITRQAKVLGLNGADLAAATADFEGLKVGLRTSANISARVENAISEAKKLAPLAIAAGKDVARSGFLPFGKAQIMFDTNTNDPALQRFATANNGLVSAYAGAMARGQKPTVSDYDHARERLSAARSQAAYEATVNQMYKEMAAASEAPQEVRSHLRGEITGKGDHGTPKPTVKPVSALPKTAGLPDDINALLNQYGRK